MFVVIIVGGIALFAAITLICVFDSVKQPTPQRDLADPDLTLEEFDRRVDPGDTIG